ncbi:MAG: aromatic ring-hydroxylating dioxygenase subunit alpha [Pseudomonadota bacterium]
MSTLESIMAAAAAPLEEAYSLPFQAYTDKAVFAAECSKIFAKEWVFVCMAGELPDAGDYFAMTLAGEPIVVLRGEDGGLRALSNICRHRGTVLLDDGFGKVDKYITCPYHAWAYDCEGALQAIPFNKLIAVDRGAHQLTKLRVSTWHGMVFVNLDANAAPLHERLAGIDEFLHLFQPETFDQASSGGTEVWQTNWKLAMENAMESYHLFKVHESTLEVFSPTRDAYYVAGSSEWSLTGGATQRQKGLVEKLMGSGYSELYDHYLLVQLAPSFVGVLSYGSFGWLSAHPIDVHKTQIRSGATFAGQNAVRSNDEFTQAFFAEDKAMCERVQRGMQAQQSKGGKLVDMERVVVDFHQFLSSRLVGAATSAYFEDEWAERWRGAEMG